MSDGEKRRGWGLRRNPLEIPRELRVPPGLRGAALQERIERLERWVDVELSGSGSLNARGTTLAALVGATIALVANFAATWLDAGWGLSDGLEAALSILLALSLIGLGSSALFALAAVWPASYWRPELSELVAALGGEPVEDEARSYAERLLRTVELQRARNERKARFMRWSYLLLAVGAALVVVQALLFGFTANSDSSEPDPCCHERASDKVEDPDPPPADTELARRYAPVVWVHPTERHGPASVENFIDASALYWRRWGADERIAAAGTLASERLGGECVRVEAGCYAYGGFLAHEMTRPHDGRPARTPGLSARNGFYLRAADAALVGDNGEGPRVPIFYEVQHGATTRIAYWFFYGFSSPYKPIGKKNWAERVSHQGDWENIEVVIGPKDVPRAVYYYGHGKPKPTPWRQVCKLVEGREDCSSAEPGRPVVYSALSSHASYGDPAPERGRTNAVCKTIFQIRIVCSYDLRAKGRLWDPLGFPEGLRNVRLEPWYGFGGAWGRAGLIGDMTGPLGPSRYKLPTDLEPGELSSLE
jgi:hypothetical protein